MLVGFDHFSVAKRISAFLYTPVTSSTKYLSAQRHTHMCTHAHTHAHTHTPTPPLVAVNTSGLRQVMKSTYCLI